MTMWKGSRLGSMFCISAWLSILEISRYLSLQVLCIKILKQRDNTAQKDDFNSFISVAITIFSSTSCLEVDSKGHSEFAD